MTRKRKFNDRINGEIQLFFREKAILEDAIVILHKYNSIGNRQYYPDYEAGLNFLRDFQRDFILGA